MRKLPGVGTIKVVQSTNEAPWVCFLINSLSHVCVLLNLSNLDHCLFLYALYVHSGVLNTI